MKIARNTGARRKQDGMTLIELLVTIAIVAVFLVLALPSLSAFLHRQQVVTTTDAVTAAIGQARSVAIATNSYITIAPIDVNGEWTQGWRVFSEGTNPTGKYVQTDKVIGQYDPPPSGVSLKFSSIAYLGGVGATGGSYLTYSPVGYTVNKDKQPQVTGNFSIAYTGTGGPSRRVIVNALGRARTCDPSTDVTCTATASQ